MVIPLELLHDLGRVRNKFDHTRAQCCTLKSHKELEVIPSKGLLTLWNAILAPCVYICCSQEHSRLTKPGTLKTWKGSLTLYKSHLDFASNGKLPLRLGKFNEPCNKSLGLNHEKMRRTNLSCLVPLLQGAD